MSGVLCVLNYENCHINYSIVTSKRKSLAIIVRADTSVIVRAPASYKLNTIESKVMERAEWIRNKLDYFTKFPVNTSGKIYEDGQPHNYRGQTYPLRIQQSLRNKVTFKNDCLHIESTSPNTQEIKRLLDRWYKEEAALLFKELLTACLLKFKQYSHLEPQELKIKKMKSRWGSLNSKRIMCLNSELIKAEKGHIEYVIIHELCHLVHFNHSPKFYHLMTCILPDWRIRKQQLNMFMTNRLDAGCC